MNKFHSKKSFTTRNITLEDMLQKHFGLRGNLCKKSIDEAYIGGNSENSRYTKAGYKAYEKFVSCLYDLSAHVRQHINTNLGKEIAALVDIFDDYEHTD